ncbi:MAG: glycosyltransferase family 4 protein [Bacteroidetes bacterium]|nr:glycosyltransferase family 4 protein [Bacteroidota bacterium]
MSGPQPVVYLTVTNCLTYDQRMYRICQTLHEEGFQVILVGIRRNDPLPDRPYRQIRLTSWFKKGKFFYLENHIRLFFYLLTKKANLFVANDLDTALPVWLVSRLRRIPRILDTHEHFTEMKEVRTRPTIHRIWSILAQFLIPRFPIGYTVGEKIAARFKELYGVSYVLVRNVPVKQPSIERQENGEPFLLYPGAVNHGRGFETLIPAMRDIPYRLVICGDGNFMGALRALLQREKVTEKVVLTGMVSPEELRQWSLRATVGVFLPDQEGANQYLGLANKFLDNIEAGLPQIIRRFPEYEQINQLYPVAILLDDIHPKAVAATVNRLIEDKNQRAAMTAACYQAREVFCWENEKNTLISLYKSVFVA